MPRVQIQTPKSLKKMCVQFIANNLDNWIVNNSSNKCDPEATFSPFEILPLVLVEEIKENIGKEIIHFFNHPKDTSCRGKLKKQEFELMITPSLLTLDLDPSYLDESNDIPYLLNLATLRCPDLKSVKFRYCPSLHLDIYVHLCAVKFEKLQELDISNSDAGDSCLQMLGMYCKDLRMLGLENCEQVTDAGIKGLCVSVNDSGMEDQRLGQCKSIETLLFGSTKITRIGIQTALKNLPFLKTIEINYNESDQEQDPIPLQIIAAMHQRFSNLNRRKYSLNSLFLNIMNFDEDAPLPYISGSLGLVASLCPSVTSVTIELIPGLTNSDMLGLLSLENVTKLNISGFVRGSNVNNLTPRHMVSFEGGVGPLLKGFGSSLRVLELLYIRGFFVNIRVIIDFCPELQSLTMIRSKCKNEEDAALNQRFKTEPLVLKNLNKLRLVEGTVEKDKISSEDLLSLLSSPSLSDVFINGCDNLTDYMFERASEINQFRSLESLHLRCCQSVSKKGMDVILNETTPLKEIQIDLCENITKEDVSLWISIAESKKWKLSVVYNRE